MSKGAYNNRNSYFSRSYFKRKLIYGEFILRQRLRHSPSIGLTFCFACRICSVGNYQSSFETSLCDWKDATKLVAEHNSTDHYRNLILTSASLASEKGRVDIELEKQAKAEVAYWIKVFAVVILLAEEV